MNKSLFGLALLSYNWETHQKDIIDSYIPLVCNIILNKSYQKINRELIKDSLLEIYGIKIPLGPVESILKRMSKESLLNKIQGEYVVNYEKVIKITKNSQKDELDLAFKQLVIDLQKYALENFEISLTNDEIESGLITFFKENDLDMLFAANSMESVLPNVKESKKAKYIIAKFITDLQHTAPSRYSIIIKLAMGYSIASLITYDDIQHYSGNLSDVQIFLDAPIIFNLLGINGESNLKLSQELIETLKTNGAILKIFEVNYQEVVKSIQDAIKRLTSRDYDITKASRILRTSIREGITPQLLQIKFNQIDTILKGSGIEKVQSPTLNSKDYRYQIDEKQLIKTIEDIYLKEHQHKIPWYKKEQIERDSESISNIFKIRRNNHATSLKTSKALLLTSNQFIAFAAKKFEKTEWHYKSSIPVCVTDIFLSTILWANYPGKSESLNIKQLISECYSIIELDNRLLNKFYDDIKKMHKENAISDEQYYMLSASNLAYTLLERKTLNDFEEYTDKTPGEILEDIELKINAELHAEQAKLTKIDLNIRRFAKFISKITFLILVAILIIMSLILKAINPKLDTKGYDIPMWLVSGAISIFGFLRWFEIIPTKPKAESAIEEFIFKKIRGWLS